jgi:hypothetical protein
MDVRDFGGAEIELCLGKEQEKHIITSPVIVPMPKGLSHGPLNFKKLPKPIIFLEVMLTRKYHSNLPPRKPVAKTKPAAKKPSKK